MTTTKKPAMTDIAAAEEAADIAEQRVIDIQSAIRAGDTSIEAGALEAAEARARFTRLRIDGVRAAQAENAERERAASIESLRNEIHESIDDPAPYVEALRDLERAAVAWLDLNDARAEQVRSWRKRLRDLGVAETRDSSTTPPEPFGIAPLSSNLGRLDIRIDGGHVGAIDPEAYLKDLFALPAAALRDPSRRNVDLHTRLARELGYIPRRETTMQ
jgi:hypothetical protein